jgi:hypothetical protein
MLLTLVFGSVCLVSGVVVGVALSDRGILTLADLQACADKLIAGGRVLTRRDLVASASQSA